MQYRLMMFIAFLVMNVVGALSASDDDAIRSRLEKAKSTYAVDIERYRAAVTSEFERKDNAARKTGDKKAVDQIKADQRVFEEKGILPPSFSATIKSQQTNARMSLETAFKAAIRDYTKAKLDDEASAVEKELLAFTKGTLRPHDAAVYRGKHYKVFETHLTWNEAKRICEDVGGQLAVIENAEENAFVTGLVRKTKLQEAWLGATDEKKEGEWVWVNGKPMTYKNWGKLQPNNKGDGENYMLLYLGFDGQWCDQPNKSLNPHKPGFVCQWQ